MGQYSKCKQWRLSNLTLVVFCSVLLSTNGVLVMEPLFGCSWFRPEQSGLAQLASVHRGNLKQCYMFKHKVLGKRIPYLAFQ
jgi:hypothetical protein